MGFGVCIFCMPRVGAPKGAVLKEQVTEKTS